MLHGQKSNCINLFHYHRLSNIINSTVFRLCRVVGRFDTFLKKSTNDCPPPQKSKRTTTLSNFHCLQFAVEKWTVSRGLYKLVEALDIAYNGMAAWRQRRHSCTTFQIRTSRRRCAKPLVVCRPLCPLSCAKTDIYACIISHTFQIRIKTKGIAYPCIYSKTNFTSP